MSAPPAPAPPNGRQAPAPDPGKPIVAPADVPRRLVAGDPDAETVGTGSVFAIGCSVGTLLLILLGVAVYVLLRVL